MRRRRLLALCGTLLTGAGCQNSADDAGTVTPVPSPGERRTVTDSETPASLEVGNPTVQPGYVAMDSPDSIGVYDDAGQYLAVEVRTDDGRPPDRSAFRFAFNGTEHPPVETGSSRALFRDGDLGADYADGEGVLVFGLPETGDPSDAALTWPGGEHGFSEGVKRRLAAPLPSFDVTLSGPGEATVDPTLEVTVTNTGEIAGRYVLAMNRIGPSVDYIPERRISGVLDAGNTETVTHDAKRPTSTDAVLYRLDAPGEQNDASHRIAPVAEKSETATERTEAATTGTRS
ncbi:hypothetical protein ACOZ4I_04055 [Haloarcula salina]|uniref:hypothetical protein n=1 Tax=Haloarcula salina TaxID=1429914 RepID=UPI003C6F9DB8